MVAGPGRHKTEQISLALLPQFARVDVVDLRSDARGSVDEVRRRLHDVDLDAVVNDWNAIHGRSVKPDGATACRDVPRPSRSRSDSPSRHSINVESSGERFSNDDERSPGHSQTRERHTG